jgi:hypothetical protein
MIRTRLRRDGDARTSLLLLAALSLSVSCADDAIDAGTAGASGTSQSTTLSGATESTTGAGGSNAGGNGSGAGQGTGVGGGLQPPTEITTCQGHIYECGDLLDNDGDGLVDSNDPDCLGPCDDTEDSYFGGIPGQAGPACKVDCYFDQDSGPGNDECYWTHECDPITVAPDFYPEPGEGDACDYLGPDEVIPPTGMTCDDLYQTQGQTCLDYCGPLTPNGCDCFGCCELPAGSDSFVWLGSEGLDGTTVCTQAEVANPEICHPCTPVAGCYNECDTCELCLGKTELPPECFGGSGGGGPGGTGGGSGTGGNPDQCAEGVQPCGLPGQAACEGGYACITGCCQLVPN